MTVKLIDHLQAARDYTIEQSKNKLKLDKVKELLMLPLQEVEETIQEMQSKKWIEEAEGVTLDTHGKIVGEVRNYRDDEEYRKAIYTRIAINHGGGTPEDIIDTIKEVYNTDIVLYRDVYSAHFYLYIQLDKKDFRGKRELIKSIAPAGVSFTLVCYAGDTPFYFSECSTEKMEFVVKKNKTINSSLDIKLESDITKTMNVNVDTIVVDQTWLGFSEIIISRRDLAVTDENSIQKSYFIDKDTALETTSSLQDFIIIGGRPFAELIHE